MKQTIDTIELSHYVYVRQSDGAVVWESILEKEFDGNLKLLLECCENNIYTVEDDGEGHGIEKIDYAKAKEDYKKSMEARSD